MKVVLVTSIDRGGPIEQSLQLARGLARRGASVLVTCANEQLAERFAVDGVRAEVVPLAHQADVGGARRVWRLARGADVIHAHDRRAGLWTRIGPRPRRGGIRVYTAHGIPTSYHPQPVGPERPGLRAVVLYRGLDASLCARADTVIVPSRAVAEDLVMRLGYPARKLVVVPNGIELPPFESRTEVEPGTEVGSRTEVEPGTEVGAHTRTGPGTGELIGTLSVLEPFKGIDVFLRAAAQLAARHPDWRFVTFGSGSDSERLAALARELGIADRVERPGFVAGGEALRRMGVYVLSSYWENAPMALLEAMAAGVPVVASAVDGVPEIVDHNTAQLVPPGDPSAIAEAIERLRANRTLRDAQVLAARDRVRERFTAERNARTIGELYERLISRAAR